VRYSSYRRWLLAPDGWKVKSESKTTLRYVLSESDETLQLWATDDTATFEFLKARQKVAWPYRFPHMVGEPAWDATRIWVPTEMGLYEVDRATGKARRLACQEETACLAVVKLGGRLYVATTRGLYHCAIPARRAP